MNDVDRAKLKEWRGAIRVMMNLAPDVTSTTAQDAVHAAHVALREAVKALDGVG